MYSDSVLEITTELCFFDEYETAPASVNTNPEPDPVLCLIPICVAPTLQLQSLVPVMGDPFIDCAVEISETLLCRFEVSNRWFLCELRNLLNRLSKIGPCCLHCIHLAADNTLIFRLVREDVIDRRFNKLGACRERCLCRFAVLHSIPIEDHVRVPGLVNVD